LSEILHFGDQLEGIGINQRIILEQILNNVE
jgi:hypothetical protein